MFSGIIREIGILEERKKNLFKFYAPKIIDELEEKDSISVNGVCLTIIKILKCSFYTFVMDITLKNSNLGVLYPKAEVNLEPALRLGAKISGHILHGQIDTCGKLIKIRRLKDSSKELEISIKPHFKDRLIEKNYIGIEGVSLTVAKKNKNNFFIYLTPYTSKETTLGKKRVGSLLNIEFYRGSKTPQG